MIRDLLRFVRGLTDRIEADMRLREISRALDVSLETLYAEMRGIREKRPEERQTEKKEGFEIGEILAAYCTLYGFYDLFSEIFPYTPAHCREIPSFSVLERIVTARDPEAAGIDPNRHKAVEVSVEAENAELAEEAVKDKFVKLLSGVAKTAFEKEKSDLAERFDPKSEEYFAAMVALLEKGKKLGIKTNRA
ncbi:MAG: primase [Patescibacteria group bacterium]|nr:primase [Patescibacteria group bacterium]